MIQKPQNQIFAPNSCCCCCADELVINGITDKPSYAPGETITVNVNCDLSSYGKTVKKIDVELQGLLTMKTNRHRIKVYTIFNSKREV